MFFLGPSANILVYLLVSAFFVVCFYIKSEPENQENLDFNYVSVVCYTEEKNLILHEISVHHVAESLIINSSLSKEEVYFIKEYDFPDKSPDNYSIYLEGVSFRGPPSL